MKRAPVKLKAWQREQGLTDADAGAFFGVTRMTWMRWKSGTMIPGPGAMIEIYIQRIAEPNDFYDLPDLLVSKEAA